MDAVILAAGEGTRLRPLTSTRPKPMLPIAGKPILEWDLEALDCAGVKKANVIVGYRREVIEEYFGGKFRGIRLNYIPQDEQLGTGHAVMQAREHVKGEFLVMNGDLFMTRRFMTSFLKAHGKKESICSMSLVEVQDPRRYGIVEVCGNKVKSLSEKPKRPKSNLANAGVYVFNENIFNLLDKVKKSARHEYELTDAIKQLITVGSVYGFKCQGQWMDIGLAWNLLDANEILMKAIKLGKSREAKIEKYAVLKGKVGVGRGSVIKSGAYVEGPVYIGENCVIGPNCYIRAHTAVMDNVKIGNAVEIKNSIIMSGTNVGHLSYLGDCVIGENCNFGAGTKVANLRFDNQQVKMEVKQSRVCSGRRKLGCIMGDDVKTGINVSIMPGKSIYPNAHVEAHSMVSNTIYTEQE